VTWTEVCALDALVPGRGACALVDGRDVAVFRLPDDRVFVLDDLDPYCGVAVLSRGIVGSRADVDVVFSPMYKNAFALGTGEAVDDPEVRVAAYPTRVVGGVVEVLAAQEITTT
jgi:nitrite reductase (NADH) small subunit